MAHECPECGSMCYCNGDIDDCLLPDRDVEAACMCCVCKKCKHDFEDCICICEHCDNPNHSCSCLSEYEDYVSPEDAKLEFEMGRGDYLRDRAKDERADRGS